MFRRRRRTSGARPDGSPAVRRSGAPAVAPATAGGSILLGVHEKLVVRARSRPDGGVVIEGHDLDPPWEGINEYEYDISIRPGDVEALVVALGGSPGDHPLDVLDEHRDEVFNSGETTWLKERGIPYEFWNRMGD